MFVVVKNFLPSVSSLSCVSCVLGFDFRLSASRIHYFIFLKFFLSVKVENSRRCCPPAASVLVVLWLQLLLILVFILPVLGSSVVCLCCTAIRRLLVKSVVWLAGIQFWLWWVDSVFSSFWIF